MNAESINSDTMDVTNTKLDAQQSTLTSILAKNGEIETSADALIAANHTDLVAIEASLTSMEGKQDSMVTALQILDNCISGNEAQVDIVSSALPSGAATESTLASLLSSSQILSEDFTTCNTGAVVLAAGSAAIGKLAANSGVDIGDVDVTSLPLSFNSGNKGSTTQRVVIATDDIPIALVNTKLDHLSDNLDTLESSANSIQSAVEGTLTVGSHAVTNAGTFAVQAACSGTVTANLSATDNAVLDVIAANTQDLESVNAKITACNTGAVVLAAGSAAIGKLSANSGVDIGDVDVTSISAGTNRIGKVVLMGNEAADGSGTERHILTDSAGNLQIDVVSTNLDLAHSATATNTAACAASLTLLDNAVDGNYLNVNQNVAGADVAVNSGNKGTSVPRICIATDDIPIALVNTKLDHLSDNLDTLESSANSIQSAVEGTLTVGSHAVTNAGTFAVQAACSGTVTANLSATDNAVLDVVAAKATLQTTSEVKEILSAATINSGNQSAQIDTENYEKVRFFGESTASVGTDIVLMGSNADGGTFYIIGENLRSETISGVHYVYGADIENLPRYIKLLNKSGSTNYIFTKLYMQGSGGRVAV